MAADIVRMAKVGVLVRVLMGRGSRARSVGAGGGVRSGYAGVVSVAFEN
jgi:hypothetical protein